MKKPTDIGTNRSGIATHPARAHAAIRGAREGQMDQADLGELIAERERFCMDAEPVGTMPPPSTLRGAAKTALSAIKGEKANVFLDKLGERVAFERSGVRLYEALLVKLEAAEPHPGGPTREQVRRIRSDEYRHFQIASKAMQSLGGDPTAVTPAADVMAVATSGLMQVLADPRTTLNQCLDAVLTAELADNDGWQLLCDMAEKLGQRDIAAQFRSALRQEMEHLENLRAWVASSVEGEAGLRDTTMRPIAQRRAAASQRRAGRRAKAQSRRSKTQAERSRVKAARTGAKRGGTRRGGSRARASR